MRRMLLGLCVFWISFAFSSEKEVDAQISIGYKILDKIEKVSKKIDKAMETLRYLESREQRIEEWEGLD